ncbi:hypothetical protein ACJIZ3_024761 [Penstemon smallii]|uniref:Uncharacterized protein n=1 Tax=Penstemon smallii TaxID=265156 RepID=A0ABD3TT39_9LAMI
MKDGRSEQLWKDYLSMKCDQLLAAHHHANVIFS